MYVKCILYMCHDLCIHKKSHRRRMLLGLLLSAQSLLLGPCGLFTFQRFLSSSHFFLESLLCFPSLLLPTLATPLILFPSALHQKKHLLSKVLVACADANDFAVNACCKQ